MSAVSEPQAVPSPPEKPPGTAILCGTCGNVCRGEVLRVQDKYFHIECFVCKACGCDLAEGGFFVRQGEYICTLDYQRLYGTRCFSCDRFIEGEVVSALGKTYHPACFVCATCRCRGVPHLHALLHSCRPCLWVDHHPIHQVHEPQASVSSKVPPFPDSAHLLPATQASEFTC
ncbi:actin-binding LIM protein 2-like [Pteropus medius]|uniref:actin-binding LIM protein 2-like n=1 Tax=Pteropus vampyrus TaxID=132908 RepID=UPI00196A8340|nr:actin-binding LIM protein 2-like [Pteropus giganteus]